MSDTTHPMDDAGASAADLLARAEQDRKSAEAAGQKPPEVR